MKKAVTMIEKAKPFILTAKEIPFFTSKRRLKK